MTGALSWARAAGRVVSGYQATPTATISDEPSPGLPQPNDPRLPVVSHQTQRPTSVADAQDHIARIRAEKGVDNPHGPPEDLVQALNLISTQLYREPTHFLQELIQNKDDCSYGASVAPEMTFTYSPGRLRVDSNELGFTRANVESLCGFGRSSKKTGDSIGRKGIGFKSVFKIADVVHLQSGFYSFKFDKATPLGMLVPKWSAFPEPCVSGGTSLLLELSEGISGPEVADALRRVDSSHILFLRRLREIHIRIYESNTWWRNALWSRPDWDTRIKRQRETRVGAFRRISISSKGRTTTCLVACKRLDKLPGASHSNGRSRSELLMGFPVGQDGSPVKELANQLVYAFLPVRQYGFMFMIQADFVLVANREDLETCSWNTAILEEIPNAFVDAVHEFNKTAFRYSWLRYLPDKDSCQPPFAKLPGKILELLSEEEVLESREGNLVGPGHLRFIPKKFRDGRGKPFLSPDSAASTTLSEDYPSCFSKQLEGLGARSLEPTEFLSQLKDFTSQRAPDFQAMPQEWHSQLSRALLNLHLEAGDLDQTIKELYIIPLDDGRWVSGNSGMVYFPSDPPLRKPMGLGIMEVDPTAAADGDRFRLLKWLGVRATAKHDFAQAIVDKHQDPKFQPRSVPSSDLISHAIFLFKANWQDSVPHFWFASEDGSYCQGRDAYLDVDSHHESWAGSATRAFSARRAEVRFLHKSYLAEFDDEKSRTWLCNKLFIETIPRLVSVPPGPPPRSPDSIVLHDDFYSLIQHTSSAEVLCLLRNNWSFYYSQLTRLQKQGSSKQPTDAEALATQVMSALSNMEVDCHGGQRAKLKDTVLPREEVLARCIWSTEKLCSGLAGSHDIDASGTLGCSVCQRLRDNSNAAYAAQERPPDTEGALLVHVPSPNDKEWHFLEHLGVAMNAGSGALLARLSRLKGLELDPQTTKSHAYGIYQQLEKWVKGDRISVKDVKSIRQSFDTDRLIFAPSDSDSRAPGIWVGTTQCIWDGPPYLKSVKRLAHHYPASRSLFSKTFEIGFATLDTFATELQNLSPRDGLERIGSLLKDVSHELQVLYPLRSSQRGEFPNFRDYRMFPVWQAGSNNLTFSLRAASGPEHWFIADKEPLRISFQGRVDLLATGTHDYESISALVVHLDLKHRLLSSHSRQVTRLRGEGNIIAREFTKSLRAKARYMSLLVPKWHPHRQEILSKLFSIEVYEALGVVTHHTVEFQGISVKGVDEEADAGVVDEGSAFKVYMRSSDLVEGRCPIEVVEQLIELCDIRGTNQFAASHLINERNAKRIEEDLTRRGIALKFEDIIPSVLEQAPVVQPWERYCPISTGFEGMDSTSFTLSTPKVVDAHRDPQFYAELYVSNLLKSIMGSEYRPAEHWTSSLRTRASYSPFTTTGSRIYHWNQWQFTVKDDTGVLTEAFSPGQVPKFSGSSTPPTYCIRVHWTTLGLKYGFPFSYDITDEVFSEALGKRPYTDTRHHTKVLARVFDIYGSPGIQFFTDPWKLFLDGSISFEIPVVRGHIEAREATALAWQPTNTRRDSSHDETNGCEYATLALEHIRLLELLPGDGSDSLTGKIHAYGINSPLRPPYRALSYAWGLDATHPSGFPLDTSDGRIELTSSLYAALRHLRAAERSEWLWVDAICIDQRNNTEKTLQIRLMQDIYRLADEVVVWLGTAESHSDLAIDILKQIYSHLSIPSDVEGGAAEAKRDDVVRQYLQGDHGGIRDLLSRSWFSRVWVIQELVWAPRATVMCGFSTISWVMFYTALRMCEEHSAKSPVDSTVTGQSTTVVSQGNKRPMLMLPNAGPLHALEYMRNRLIDQHRKLRLLDLLDKFAYARATVPRDKIFALLSLACDNHTLFYADYESEFEDLIRRFARGFIEQGEAMHLLSRSGTGKAYKFCSWIPDWTADGKGDATALHKTISTWKARGGHGRESSRFQVSADAPQPGPREPWLNSGPRPALNVPGRCVDRITVVARTALPTAIQDRSSSLNMKLIRNIRAVIYTLCGNSKGNQEYRYPTGEALEDVIIKLLIGDANGPHSNISFANILENRDHALPSTSAPKPPSQEDASLGRDGSAGWEADLKTVISSVYLDADVSAYESLPQKLRVTYAKYWETAVEFAGRFPSPHFAVTERGYLCVVPGATAKGDIICAFPGGRVPFLLRPRHQQSTTKPPQPAPAPAPPSRSPFRFIGKKPLPSVTETISHDLPSRKGPYRLIGECYVHGIMFGEDKPLGNGAVEANEMETFALE